jgi:ferritin-like metal-binding protein YciE
MKITNFTKLIEHQIEDLYDAEKQIVEALPKLVSAASDPGLKKGFEDHLKQTKKQVERLEEVAESLDFELKPITCKGMQGLIEEGEEVIDSVEEGILLDVALIGAAKRVEHYEITAYDTLLNHLEEAGLDDAISVLQTTLSEEEETDEILTALSVEVTSEAASDMEE